MSFFRNLISLFKFIGLPEEQRQITLYSEGENYWPYLEALVQKLLDTTPYTLNYISSSPNDPGLQISHQRLNTFTTDEGHLRNYLFENLSTRVMIMTMPDLGSFQIKRSRSPVHYVYVQHSLVSLHMAYRDGAFDHFDTVFCAGPHHVKEMEALQAQRQLRPIQAIPHGYPRLDSILAEAQARASEQAPDSRVDSPANSSATSSESAKHVLVAPTWGPKGAIESGAAATVVSDLLAQGHQVTLRPHPQTLKLSAARVSAIVNAHKNNKRFSFEANVSGQESLHQSDVMISDWSGAALDYAFGLGKPVVFLDLPKKVNNDNWESLGLVPFEESIRSTVGRVCPADAVTLPAGRMTYDLADHVYNAGDCATVGAAYIAELVDSLTNPQETKTP